VPHSFWLRELRTPTTARTYGTDATGLQYSLDCLRTLKSSKNEPELCRPRKGLFPQARTSCNTSYIAEERLDVMRRRRGRGSDGRTQGGSMGCAWRYRRTVLLALSLAWVALSFRWMSSTQQPR
jgi:hypothetical protein